VTNTLVIRVLALLTLLLISIPALATPRTALVIGNGDYQSAPLGNPPADARAMAEKLRQLEFQVIEVIDVDRTEMRTAIRDFSQLLRTRGGVGLFFYAGHGVQVGGKNFLLPVGVDIQQAFEVPDEALDMNAVLRAMEHAGNDMNVVILDACRNNPFTRSFRSVEQGLARMEGPTGSLIAYSTAPGSVAADGDGDNSPYTQRLLDAMDTPGLSLEQVFKRVREGVVAETNGAQVPWEHSSLLGEFYFHPESADGVATTTAPAASPQTDIPPVTAAVPTVEVELSFWESIKDSNDPAYFQAYLEQYPQGNFTSLARLKLETLDNPGPASRSASPALAPAAEPVATTQPAPEPESIATAAPTIPTPRAKPAVPAPTASNNASDPQVQRIIQAARGGDPIAQGLLGRLFASGQGVPQDLLQAYIWSALATERGVKDAKPVRDFLGKHLDREQRKAADRQVAKLLEPYQEKKHPKKAPKPKKKHRHNDDDDD